MAMQCACAWPPNQRLPYLCACRDSKRDVREKGLRRIGLRGGMGVITPEVTQFGIEQMKEFPPTPNTLNESSTYCTSLISLDLVQGGRDLTEGARSSLLTPIKQAQPVAVRSLGKRA